MREDKKLFFTPNSRTAKIIDGLEKIAYDVYIYKNFVPKEIVEEYTTQLKGMRPDEWYIYHNNYEPGDISTSWEDGKISRDILGDAELNYYIFNFFTPEYVNSGKNTYVIRLQPGESTEIYTGKSDKSTNLNLGAKYKIGVYFGEWTGGEICFPEIDLKVKPEEGDLILWKASYDHYVSEVKSGIRYSYSDFLILAPDFVVA